jgi:CRISPR-associated protein Csx14
MSRQTFGDQVLIATLGDQPQVVTVALDLLLEQPETEINEVALIHTAPTGVIGESLRRLEAEFADDVHYLHKDRACDFRRVPVRIHARTIADVTTEPEAGAVLQTVYDTVRHYKQKGCLIHLSIAGGRKPMAVFGLAAAYLLFDLRDRLWHLFSSREFIDCCREKGLMHARKPEDAQLVPIPVVPWGAFFPALSHLAIKTPDEIVEIIADRAGAETRRRCRDLLDQLTRREREILRLIAEGKTPQEVAERLFVSRSTVASHLTSIFGKFRNVWELPVDSRQTYHDLWRAFHTYYTS